MSTPLTKNEVKELYTRLYEIPAFVETLNQYEKAEVLTFAKKMLIEATGLSIEILSNNPNYSYPEKFKTNPLDYWNEHNDSYKQAKFVIDLLTNKLNVNTIFKAELSEQQIEKLFAALYPNFIETDIDIFSNLLTGKQKSTTKQIIWKPIGRNKQPNIKALLDFFYIMIEKFNIKIVDKVLFDFINKNFISINGKKIMPKSANKSNPPKIPQSEFYLQFEKLFKTL